MKKEIHRIGENICKLYTDRFLLVDTEEYDLVEEDWIEAIDEDVITSINTAITKNGRYIRFSDVKEGQEAVVIKPDKLSNASVVLIKD